MAEILLHINGVDHHLHASEDEMLLYILRERLNLTGTKYGCGEGQCGACTVLVDGRPIRSCHTRPASVAAKKITTIEGLSDNGQLHRVQQAFLDEEAFQCAYCTPGMIIAATQIIDRNPNPSRDEIRHGLEGNLCRCTGYQHIVEAVEYAAKKASA